MEAEWDVIEEIWSTLAALGTQCHPIMEWIKGHQDDERPREQLTLKARLNCQADDLTGEYMIQVPAENHTLVKILPTTGCQLHLRHGTTTRDIKRELALARTVPPMKAKLCLKNDWSEENYESIDWESHGRALNRLIKHKSTLVKYLNDILPVGKLVNKYNAKYPKSCPSCPAELEDREHLRQCQTDSRKKWRKECYSNMLKELNAQDTAPALQALLLDALDALLYDKNLDTINIDPSVADVAAAQKEIGWHQLLYGRFANEWKHAHNRYLGGRATSKKNGTTWTTTLATTWLQQWLNLWKLRNEDRHGRDEATEKQARDSQTIREATMFYQNHEDQVGQNLQWLFRTPLQDRIQGNINNLRIFIDTWLPVVEKSYTTALSTG